MEYNTKAKIGSYYKDGFGQLYKIISIDEYEEYPVSTMYSGYTLDGNLYNGRKSNHDLDLSKEYDKNGNLICDHNIDISKIPTVEEQKKFTKELNEKMKNPYLNQEGGSHYKDMKIQPSRFCHANGLGGLEFAAIKYICRWKNKNGIEDLKKAIHTLQILIYEEENK